jgi:hypothetical protein
MYAMGCPSSPCLSVRTHFLPFFFYFIFCQYFYFIFTCTLLEFCVRRADGFFVISLHDSAKQAAHISFSSLVRLVFPVELSVLSLLRVRSSCPSLSSPFVQNAPPFFHVDIIEEIISEEIVDETDRYEDNVSKKQARRITSAAIMRGYAYSLFSHHTFLPDICENASLAHFLPSFAILISFQFYVP